MTKKTDAHLDAAEDAAQPLDPLVRLWVLRVLFLLNCSHKLDRRHEFGYRDAITALGFSLDTDHKAMLSMLRDQYEEAEARRATLKPPAMLERNVGRLGQLLQFKPAECRILEFAVLLHDDEVLHDFCGYLGTLSSSKNIRGLSKILCIPRSEVEEALSGAGILARSGILTRAHRDNSLHGFLDPLSSAFVQQMLTVDCTPTDWLRGRVTLTAKAELDEADFAHMSHSLDLLRPYLREAVAEARRGVNIFLYGPPGTGKTQLARWLAGELGCELFEVSSEDEDGDPIDGEQRLRAYGAAQTLLATRQSLILFDEVEDVFADGGGFFGRKSIAQTRKAWMNRMLEEAATPTLWLSNSIKGIDPAFMRRFDMVIELPIPPEAQRRRIAERACGDLASVACVARIAAAEHLAPAVVTRAASVARVLRKSLEASKVEGALEQLIGNTLTAQGHAPLARHDPNRLPDSYDLAFLNPDSDLQAIAQGLKDSGSGRLCLYGPPGTGKTAFGRWLARQLGVPLRIKRASDILSPYVGMTEKNLARTFREAGQEGALLMIDEVDSFLRDRAQAQRSWEVTGVNEMLTQMEAFAGIFIASTNLMEGLDQAALRRFDVKVRLDFLTAPQAAALLRAQCHELGLNAPCSADELAVGRIGQLAPGDFAALARQHRFRPVRGAGQLVEMLRAEAALKDGNRRPMGFMN